MTAGAAVFIPWRYPLLCNGMFSQKVALKGVHMNTIEIAKKLAELCQQGRNMEALERRTLS
jgi:hypothetical protein